jgi:hypothetical protein
MKKHLLMAAEHLEAANTVPQAVILTTPLLKRSQNIRHQQNTGRSRLCTAMNF